MTKRDGLVPIKLEVDPTDAVVTGYAGALVYLDLWNRMGMPALVDEIVHICGTQGWMDRQIVTGLMLLNLVGGDCVDDMEKLEEDKGLCSMVRACEYDGLNSAQRRIAQKRFRSGRNRSLPAPTQISAFLESCHDEKEEGKRSPGTAFIPQANNHLVGLRDLNTQLVARIQRHRPQKIATLDGDATLVESDNRNALYCYKGPKAYQPFNVWWAEQQLVLHSEFRDGNVPAGFDIVRVLKDALRCLPAGVEKVYVRQDTAAYDVAVLAWCEREREHPEYGRIEFTISADITQAFKDEVHKEAKWTKEWRGTGPNRRQTGREWAEIVFVPATHAALTDIREPFRYIAIREKMGDQLTLLDAGTGKNAPFPTIVMNNQCYKLHAIVTNRRDEPAEDLIRWHFERCGKSEEAHSIMKSDFAGGKTPSAKFGANAAWWALMILTMNFQMAMKRLVLGPRWEKKRMKATRFELINSAGRLVSHSRQCFLRVTDKLHDWLFQLREAVRAMKPLLE
jgi:hypothetical protein